MAQALPGLGVISIQDYEAGLTLLVKKICAQRDFTAMSHAQSLSHHNHYGPDQAQAMALLLCCELWYSSNVKRMRATS